MPRCNDPDLLRGYSPGLEARGYFVDKFCLCACRRFLPISRRICADLISAASSLMPTIFSGHGSMDLDLYLISIIAVLGMLIRQNIS